MNIELRSHLVPVSFLATLAINRRLVRYGYSTVSGNHRCDPRSIHYDYSNLGQSTDEACQKFYRLRNLCLNHAGDLGWTLAYATAFCYRHITKNRDAIISAVNYARRAPVSMLTPFLIFDTLDRDIFAAKLQDMICLCWQSMASDHPGNTYVPGIKAARICIQLNSTPFDQDADLDDLLRMLLHHMIHAYFLVCCGSPQTGDKLDGRLLDGVQFGVLLSCINDVSQDCEHGSVGMEFHAHWRQKYSSTPQPRMQSSKRSFIALDPSASTAAPAMSGGKSCCQLDNRNVSLAQVYNWQVEEYAKAIADNWDCRGDNVFFPQAGDLTRVKRTAGPPSSTYIELVWDGRHIAVSKKQADKFPTLARMGQDNKFNEVRLPSCESDVMLCLWRFIQYDYYRKDLSQRLQKQQQLSLGAPVLLSPHSRQGEDITLHVRVCKLADTMRFPELHAQALSYLSAIPATSDDPITVLRVLYDESTSPSLNTQSWCRRFLARTDGRATQGVSNYEKVLAWHSRRFLALYHKHAALRDDCKLAVASLAAVFTCGSVEKDLCRLVPRYRDLPCEYFVRPR